MVNTGFFRKGKKEVASDDDPDRHHVDALDYFEETEREELIDCPECAKEQRHVRMVRTEGEELECPECHYLRETRRV